MLPGYVSAWVLVCGLSRCWVLVCDACAIVKISPSVHHETPENLNISWRTRPVH